MQFHTIYGGSSFSVKRAGNGHTPLTPERVEVHNLVLRSFVTLSGPQATQFLEALTNAHDMEAVCRDAWFRYAADLD